MGGNGTDYNYFSGALGTVHILDWACRSQRHVTRSTFSAELFAAGAAAGHGALISHTFREIENGPMPMFVSRNRRTHGGYVPTALYLDAKSAYAAILATFITPSAENPLLCHIQYLRELLDKYIIRYLFRIDTRDMMADGLAQGSVARNMLHLLMDGTQTLLHEREE